MLKTLGLYEKFKHHEDIPKDRPCCFVGGPWPGLIHGSVRANCGVCNAYLSWEPHTQRQLKDRTADTLVLCMDCARQRIDKEAAEALAERAVKP